MTLRRLIFQSLLYYWRTHLGVVLGAALATGVLIGALAVGDSVRFSLRAMALARLGDTELAIGARDRFFTEALATNLAEALDARAAPLMILNAVAATQGGLRRAPDVRVIGVDNRFWSLGDAATHQVTLSDDSVVINRRLAELLDVKVGDRVILRVAKPSALPRDVPLGSDIQNAVALTLNVSAVLADDTIGRFSLQANQIPPLNAFVPLKRLQERVGVEGRANTLLLAAKKGADAIDVRQAEQSLRSQWTLADGELEVRSLPQNGVVELRSRRVFLEQPVITAAQRTVTGGEPVLTYFVNDIRAGNGRATPYSMVAAMQPPSAHDAATDSPLPEDLADDEIVVTRWLADDLEVHVGDRLTLRYFVIGPSRELREHATTFRIRDIIAVDHPGIDRALMPDFPGLAGVESSHDWQPGIPIDFSRIRDKDERYWKRYRGTPKAIVSLRWAQKAWSNRFGDLTAIRWPIGNLNPQELVHEVTTKLRAELDPGLFGLSFIPVREQALAASRQGYDFSSLFIGFSFFLIVAALLLTGLLFVFGVEQRSSEIGMLLAVGLRPRRVRFLLLWEGAALSVVGTAVGVAVGIGYTRAALWGLTTVWRDAVSTAALGYHLTWQTLGAGVAASIVAAVLTMTLTLRRQARQPARVLLGSRFGLDVSPLISSRRAWLTWLGVALIAAAMILAIAVGVASEHAADVFFTSGSMVLVGGLLLCRRGLIGGVCAGHVYDMTLAHLGRRNNARRPGRALATISMLACGCFMVVAVSAFRHGDIEAPSRRDSGTGGFMLYAQTSLPILQNLNTPAGRDAVGIDDDLFQGVSVVAMRLKEGDDASCLNLNRAQSPRLLGVDPTELATRGAFVFAKTLASGATSESQSPWQLLDAPVEPGDPIPAVTDLNTAMWALGKSLGDTLTYTDEQGKPFRVRLVGLLGTSILQGQIVIAEKQLIKKYPSLSGDRVFLIDAPPERTEVVKNELAEALRDSGVDIMPTSRRLALFNAVENTYLSIFQVLGGLGLVLGTVALGIVVLRNLLERRNELAVLRAIGYRYDRLRRLVLSEHRLILLLGVAVGVPAAAVAIWPALRTPGVSVPYTLIGLTVAGILVIGIGSIRLATAIALRGPLIDALRNE